MSKKRLALIECYFTKSNSQDPLGGNPVKNWEENEFYIYSLACVINGIQLMAAGTGQSQSKSRYCLAKNNQKIINMRSYRPNFYLPSFKFIFT